jgi:hypothetical protein
MTAAGTTFDWRLGLAALRERAAGQGQGRLNSITLARVLEALSAETGRTPFDLMTYPAPGGGRESFALETFPGVCWELDGRVPTGRIALGAR